MSSADADGEQRAAGSTVLGGTDVTVSYGTVEAITDVDFHVNEGEIVGVVGPNGAGKTTLANAITGFLEYEGHVEYMGREVREQGAADLVAQGLIHCTEQRDLFGYMSVEDNLLMGAYRRGWDDHDRQLEYVYSLFPRLEERADQAARTMSGGEQQMLAIGRALMSKPVTLVLDEPTLGLAPIILEDISEALREINDEGVTAIICEQNVTFTMTHADRVYLLENGAFVREGDPETLRGDEYVRDVYLGG